MGLEVEDLKYFQNGKKTISACQFKSIHDISPITDQNTEYPDRLDGV